LQAILLKVVVACRGDKRRELSTELPATFTLPAGFSGPQFCLPGVLAIQAPAFEQTKSAREQADQLCRDFENTDLSGIPLILLVDDSRFAAATLNNWLWVAFTRSNPSHDVYGVQAFTEFKHWGCRGPLVIDARKKPHHAPELIPDPAIQKRVEELLSGYKF
jgi:4-hydroxy-3-polyprenylbenzoate decarboxylase